MRSMGQRLWRRGVSEDGYGGDGETSGQGGNSADMGDVRLDVALEPSTGAFVKGNRLRNKSCHQKRTIKTVATPLLENSKTKKGMRGGSLRFSKSSEVKKPYRENCLRSAFEFFFLCISLVVKRSRPSFDARLFRGDSRVTG